MAKLDEQARLKLLVTIVEREIPSLRTISVLLRALAEKAEDEMEMNLEDAAIVLDDIIARMDEANVLSILQSRSGIDAAAQVDAAAVSALRGRGLVNYGSSWTKSVD